MTSDKIEDLQAELERIDFRIYKSKGSYNVNFEQWRELKAKEEKISRSPKLIQIPIKEVIADIERTGSEDARKYLPKVFLDNTQEDTREAYNFGEEGLVVYFGVGTFSDNKDLDLGLISAHIPGGNGGGGWGSNGTRKFQIARKSKSGGFNPMTWIDNSIAWAYEFYNGKLHYSGDNSNRNLMVEFIPGLKKDGN